MRWFVIRMQAPANGTGRGTLDDPWRPMYLRELGLGITNTSNFRYWIVGQVTGDDAVIDTLDSNPGAFELREGRAIPAAKRTAMETWLSRRGAAANLDLTGEAMALELKRICLWAQQRETEQERQAMVAELK